MALGVVWVKLGPGPLPVRRSLDDQVWALAVSRSDG